MNLKIKTELTKELEHNLWKYTNKQGTFGCFEVTIGWFGKERVDYITYDTKGIWRCYEVKISKSDFHSKAHNTFVGHYNYYVMPNELYQEVKNEIPNHVGVIIDGDSSIKKAKKQELKVDEQILKNSIIRSLCRDVDKHLMESDTYLIDNYNREISRLRKECSDFRSKYYKLYHWICEKYGRKTLREIQSSNDY